MNERDEPGLCLGCGGPLYSEEEVHWRLCDGCHDDRRPADPVTVDGGVS